MKKSIYVLLALIGLLLVASCTSEDNTIVPLQGACEEGIVNCNETGIDYVGLSFAPFMDGMTVLGRSTEMFVSNNDNRDSITYNISSDASNAPANAGFDIAQNYTAKLAALKNVGTLSLFDKTWNAMGHPIDVVCNHKLKTVCIAEKGNSKVLILSDALNASSNVALVVSSDLMSEAYLHLYNS